MFYYAYMLKSISTGYRKTYVGYTNNLKNRIKLHNTSKGAKFTKGRTWELIYSKSKALSFEYKLKKDRKERSKLLNEFKNKN